MNAATAASAQASSASLKRKSPSDDKPSTPSDLPPSPSTALDPPVDSTLAPAPKRAKLEGDNATRNVQNLKVATDGKTTCSTPPTPPLSNKAVAHSPDLGEVTDIVSFQFSHEILVKHNELRLIEQEMAKCQIAVEQLRRCHLIPYPTACPTYEQMLDISSGRGPAVRTRPGAPVPEWAAPFGVTDGPYARHYAKWLIPDPMFDGIPVTSMDPPSGVLSRSRSGVSADVRSTRNNSSIAPAVETSKSGRPTRTNAGQKLQSLANAYPPARNKAGPCVLKRSDGETVKLVCVDCIRDDFSSTQGFINHCRIAHKREYKTHDEAAMHCGQPLDADDPVPPPAATVAPKSRKASAAPARASVASSVSGAATASAGLGQVSRFARTDNADTEANLKRMESINGAYCYSARGTKPTDWQYPPAPKFFPGTHDAPRLSMYLEDIGFTGDVAAAVVDAKASSGLELVDWDAVRAEDAKKEAEKAGGESASKTSKKATSSLGKSTPVRAKAAKVAKTTKASVVAASGRRAATGSRGLMQSHSPVSPTPATGFDGTAENAASPNGMFDDEMETDSSPLPLATSAYNAPSLVSDDGEYDDSEDEHSVAGADPVDVDMDLEASSGLSDYISDVNEDDEPTRPLGHHRGVKLRRGRDGAKHVAFVSPVKGSNKGKHE